MRKPTIHEIKAAVAGKTHFFDRETMKHWGQTMKSFSVEATERPDAWRISAPIKNGEGQVIGKSERVFHAGNLYHGMNDIPE